ncbi:668_t:CDS:10, partial [Entrophospora sp. SA101]
NQLSNLNVAMFWEEVHLQREMELKKMELKNQIEITRVNGVLHMFEATNVSQQHVINIQHQDLLSIYQPHGVEQVNAPVTNLPNILNSHKKRKTEDNFQESWSKRMTESHDGNLNDELDWYFNNPNGEKSTDPIRQHETDEEGELTKYVQEELNGRVELPTCYNQENENKENVPTCKKVKKSVPNTKNPRPRNDSKESSEIPSPCDVGLKDDDEIKFDFTNIERELLREPINEWVFGTINVSRRFRQYQIEVLKKAKTKGLKWILPIDVLSFLRNALADSLEGKTAFLSLGDSEIGRTVSRIFNDMCTSVPDVSPSKTSEDEHCFKLLHPIIRPLFFTNSYKGYDIRLNRATSGIATRPDFLCLVNEISILNSEIKPPGFTPLQQQKDKLKVQLRGRKSINQLLRTKGGPAETVLLINQGDLVESYVMDLKYDGLYWSWSFLTTRLERISKIAEDYNRRTCQSGTNTPPLQTQYMRDLPSSPQIKEILNSKC